MIRNLLRNLTVAALLFVTSGCLLSTSSSVQESGVTVGSATLNQVELGKTTEGWLTATLGEPTSRAAVRGPDNVQILGYNHEVVRSSRGKVFLIFSGSSKKVEKADTFFEVTNGVVTKYWREG